MPLMLVYALGYGVTHPLRFAGQFDGGQRTLTRDPGASARYLFRLDNTSRTLVTELEQRLALEVRQGASCPTTVARLDALWIRYTVLGMRHEQRIPLVDGPAVPLPLGFPAS